MSRYWGGSKCEGSGCLLPKQHPSQQPPPLGVVFFRAHVVEPELAVGFDIVGLQLRDNTKLPDGVLVLPQTIENPRAIKVQGGIASLFHHGTIQRGHHLLGLSGVRQCAPLRADPGVETQVLRVLGIGSAGLL